MDYVTEAIDLVSGMQPRDDSFEALQEVYSGIEKVAAKLEPKATGDLRAFDIAAFKADGSGEVHTTLRSRGAELPSGLEQAVGNMWSIIGGVEDHVRAVKVIEAARIEYVRSQFSGALSDYAWLDFEREKERARLATLDWIDADAICRNPWPQHLFTTSAAEGFRDWILNISGVEEAPCYEARSPTCLLDPRPTPAVMTAAITLSWIDEAICSPSSAFLLFGEAMGAIRYVYPNASVHGGDSQARRYAEFRLHGKKGPEQRNAKLNELKVFALEKYRAGHWASANDAANKLKDEVMAEAKNLGVRLIESNAQRTFADWFRAADKESEAN